MGYRSIRHGDQFVAVRTMPVVAKVVGAYLTLMAVGCTLLLVLMAWRRIFPDPKILLVPTFEIVCPIMLAVLVAGPMGLWLLTGNNRVTIIRSANTFEVAKTILGIKVLKQTYPLTDISDVAVMDGKLGQADYFILGAMFGAIGGTLMSSLIENKSSTSPWVVAIMPRGNCVVAGPIRRELAISVAREIADAVGLIPVLSPERSRC